MDGRTGRRFLIVDDSATMRRILEHSLALLGYPGSLHAANGKDALRVLSVEPVDAIITDWQMPEMNGLDLIKALQSTPDTSYLPILVVTGSASVNDVRQALALGIHGYILKPFNLAILREKVEAIASYMSTYSPALSRLKPTA